MIMKKVISIVLIYYLLCSLGYANTICCGTTEIGRNNKQYLREQWKEFLGFDLFNIYFSVKQETNRFVVRSIRINKFDWDITLKIKQDNINFRFAKEF